MGEGAGGEVEEDEGECNTTLKSDDWKKVVDLVRKWAEMDRSQQVGLVMTARGEELSERER